MTSELAALQPFLVATDEPGIKVTLIEPTSDRPVRGVRVVVRRAEGEWLVILVNEDDHRHMGVEVTGLGHLNGRDLYALYEQERITIQRGELVTRMQPYEVKVFSTSRTWESPRRAGRDYKSIP